MAFSRSLPDTEESEKGNSQLATQVLAIVLVIQKIVSNQKWGSAHGSKTMIGNYEYFCARL